MGAYNDLRFEARCPACGQAAAITAQTHAASSFDGDDDGRFAHETYALGRPMRWWRRDDPRWESWREETMVADGAGGWLECCHAECEACRGEICALIRFRDVVPVEAVLLGRLPDWPAGFLR